MVIGYLIGVVISFVILYYVIRAAVLSALTNHWKMVRLYEETGEWSYGRFNHKEPQRFN